MAYVHNNLFKSNSGFEHRLDRQRAMDDRRNVTIRYLKDDNRAQLSNTFLDRSDAYRRRREADEQAKEASLLEDIQRREKIREAFKLSREEDDFIAKQLSDQDKEYQREQRVLEKLRLESPELRALQTKLQIAEMNKLRHQQLEEKRLMELEEAARNAGFHKLMELQMIKEDALEHERLRKRFGNMMDAKQRIQEQLKEREIIKEQELQERLKETEELTEELAKLREEQITEAYRKLRKKAQVRQTMVEGQKVREEMKRKKERQEKEEEDAIMAYRAKIEERLRMQDVGKKEKRDEEQRIHNELSAKKLAEMRAKEDMENAINDYYFEESEALYHKKMEELRIQKERIQANLRAACQMHEQFKEERRQQERLDKKEFARRMLESMEKEFKLEQLSAQRRRMKIEEYKREIDQAWLEKEAAFQSQLEEANERRRKEEEEARWREALVERERKKLLAEHAVKLADYLPKGTLSKPEDLTIVGIKPSPEDTSVGKPYRPF